MYVCVWVFYLVNRDCLQLYSRVFKHERHFITVSCYHVQLEGKYSLESTDPRESEIRAPPQPIPYLMPIPPNTLFFYNK